MIAVWQVPPAFARGVCCKQAAQLAGSIEQNLRVVVQQNEPHVQLLSGEPEIARDLLLRCAHTRQAAHLPRLGREEIAGSLCRGLDLAVTQQEQRANADRDDRKQRYQAEGDRQLGAE